MAKLTRKLLKVFGGSGASTNFAEFGSQVAGTPVKSKDIETIQSLAAWDNGLQDAVVAANKAPYLEDMNALLYVLAYQLAYNLQEGIPEWNTDTSYYIGSIVKKTGTTELYASIIDDNVSNALPARVSDSKWRFVGELTGLNPAGTIIIYGSKTPPPGYLYCDGSSVLRSSYPALFAAIGTSYGAADVTHFNVPDMRGRFLRGLDDGVGRDEGGRTADKTGGASGDNIGSVQGPANLSHLHYLSPRSGGNIGPLVSDGAGSFSDRIALGGPSNVGTLEVGLSGGSESRPFNINVAYMIKY